MGIPARPPGRKAVGILLAPTTGRVTAFAIVGVPLVLFLILGFKSAGGGSSDPSGYYGGQSQYQPGYPLGTTTQAEPQDTYSPYAAPSDSAASDYSSSATDTTSPTATGSPTGASSASPSSSAAGPAAVVIAAYADINKRDYQGAYNLGLDQNGDSEATFAAGYSTTQSVDVTIKHVGGETVYVGLLAMSTSGVQTSYEGTYTVSGGLITGASLQQVN